MVNNILIEVLGTIAEQERETIRKRQAEGIEAAKAKGKKFGRPALDFPPKWDKVYASWKAGEHFNIHQRIDFYNIRPITLII